MPMPPYSDDPTQPNTNAHAAPQAPRAPYSPYPPYPPNTYPNPYPPANTPYPPYGHPYPAGAYPAQPVQPARPAAPRRPAAKSPTLPRMSKAEALAITRRLKRGTVWVALGAFAVLEGLVGSHVVGVTSAAPASSTGTGGSNSDNQQPSTQQNNPFFGNQPGSGPFGSNGSGSQSPVTGTGTS